MFLLVKNTNDGNEDGYSKLIEKADSIFLKAEALEKAKPELQYGYLYRNWWMALYYRGEYTEAWEKVFLMRKEGGELSGNFVQGLKKAMPEPKKSKNVRHLYFTREHLVN